MNHILIVAHAPLASALKACALHVFPDADAYVSCIDVLAQQECQMTTAQIQHLLLKTPEQSALLLTDLYGATPCNITRDLPQTMNLKALTGVNLPMLIRAITYRHESLAQMSEKALEGGARGVMSIDFSCVKRSNS